MPAPPGVTGRTVSRRTNANAAKVVCQGASDWDRPTPRTLASRTSHKARLLAAVAAEIFQPRSARSPAARSRNRGSDPAADGGGLRASRQAMASAGGACAERNGLAPQHETETKRGSAGSAPRGPPVAQPMADGSAGEAAHSAGNALDILRMVGSAGMSGA